VFPQRCPCLTVFVAVCAALLGCSDGRPVPPKRAKPISEQVAIQRAEVFVRTQGYTDAAATAPLQRESLERGTDQQIRELRRNTLQSVACGAWGTGDRTAWTVGFRYRTADQGLIRVVSVNGDGSLEIEHQDLKAVPFCASPPSN
jgi:hypothetical protein